MLMKALVVGHLFCAFTNPECPPKQRSALILCNICALLFRLIHFVRLHSFFASSRNSIINQFQTVSPQGHSRAQGDHGCKVYCDRDGARRREFTRLGNLVNRILLLADSLATSALQVWGERTSGQVRTYILISKGLELVLT